MDYVVKRCRNKGTGGLRFNHIWFGLHLSDEEDKLIDYILQGMTIVMFSHDKQYIIVNTKKVERRAVTGPELTFTLRGSRDCFNENLDTNYLRRGCL